MLSLTSAGLVELHPLGARRGELREQFGVHRQQVVEAVERLEALGRALARLAEQQEGHRPDEDRAGAEAGRRRLGDLAHQAVATRARTSVSGPISGTR